ncbi:ABC transporter permease [Paenibacillus mucilaginosus]|uniref:Binding-protein-dependent transport systems inner membrane component n=1 Tax=Paenibacillus mucilaginosus (strain KNP414) TaxID=1036673 RepID=F8F6B9_PAEMK|nr:ABC transporter permease subunit [Paenibacillus mucilaginosus]AEI42393.1 binding-protein-dependent transport systems inner membrane component [Paenibacillus mucilaginosus KNP414]
MNVALSNNKADSVVIKKKKKTFFSEIKQNFYLYLLVFPGVLFFVIFKYLPMVGIIVAFQDFNIMKGLFKSEFVGLKNFEYFFTSKDWLVVTWNTVYLNLLFLFTGLFFSILIALVLSEISSKYFKKVTQSVVILPNFISWTLVSMFVFALLSTDVGFINSVLKTLGIIQEGQEINFYSNPALWTGILVVLKIWKTAGFGSVIYLAAIAGIDQEIYEAAKIDGASRMQCITKITLPQLRTTAVLMTLFGIGNIFDGDLGMIYAIVGDNPNLYETTDVIDTYVFRMLRQMNDFSMTTAIGLYQALVGFVIVYITNYFAKKYDSDSAIF